MNVCKILVGLNFFCFISTEAFSTGLHEDPLHTSPQGRLTASAQLSSADIQDLFVQAMTLKNSTTLLERLRPAAANQALAQEKLYGFLTNTKFAPNIGLSLTPDTEAEAQTLYNLGIKQNQDWAMNRLRETSQNSANHFVSLLYPETDTLKPKARKKIIKDFFAQWKSVTHPLPYIALLLKCAEMQKHPPMQWRFWESIKTLIAQQDTFYELKEANSILALANKQNDRVQYTNYLYLGGLYGSIIRSFQVAQRLADDKHQEQALNLYHQLAQKGHVQAMVNAGVLLAQEFVQGKPDKQQALHYFLQAAKKGHVQAMVNAGILLDNGFDGQDPDKKQALNFYTQAAEQGDIDAMVLTGHLLQDGFEEQKPDKKQALTFFTQAANKGSVAAMNNAGALLEHGFEGQKPDKRQALELYQKAAERGEVYAMTNASFLLKEGFDGQEPDIQRAYDLSLKAAQRGYAKGMFNVGVFIEDGFEGQDPDKKQAFHYYQQAVKRGYVPALMNAGLLLEKGFEGQKSDKKQAFDLYQKAVQQGDNGALLNIALLLHFGFEGQEPDIKQAFTLYKQAAQTGDAKATFNLGILLEEGFDGQDPNKKEALEFYKKAAGMGLVQGMFHAGVLLEEGFEGQDPDKKQALNYFRQAAEKDHINGMIKLGNFILETDRSSESLSQALFWLEKAKALGSQDAEHYIEIAQNYLADTVNLDDEESDKEFDDLCAKITTPILETSSKITKIASGQAPKNLEASFAQEEEALATFDEDSDLSELEDSDSDQEMLDAFNDVDVTTAQQKRLHLKHQMRKLIQLQKQQHEDRQKNTYIPLSAANQQVIQLIREGNYAVSDNQLYHLFKDPFFQNQICVHTTKSGLCVSVHKRDTNDHMTFGKHRKHTKDYKGQHWSFIQDIKTMLSLFNVLEQCVSQSDTAI